MCSNVLLKCHILRGKESISYAKIFLTLRILQMLDNWMKKLQDEIVIMDCVPFVVCEKLCLQTFWKLVVIQTLQQTNWKQSEQHSQWELPDMHRISKLQIRRWWIKWWALQPYYIVLIYGTPSIHRTKQ
jgi:hypothetical protein